MNPEIVQLFNDFQVLAGSSEAAATLVLAQVQAVERTTDNVKPPSHADYLTVKQAAKKYSLGERTIYRMVEEGLPVVRAGRAIRIKPRDLEKRLADSETLLR